MIRILKNRLALISLLAGLVNFVLLFFIVPAFSSHLQKDYSQEVYADGYDYLAGNLADGYGYRFYPDTASTTMREPGYPLLLAGLRLVFGTSFTAVAAANFLLTLATAWLILHLARRVSRSPVVYYAAPLLFLLHPATVVAESRGGVEILFAFLLVFFMNLLYRAMESRRWVAYALSGAVLGLAVLVKSTPILFPIFLLGFLLFFERGRRLVAVGRVAVMIFAMYAVLSPWIARNYSLTGKFIPTASVLGVSLQAGEYICEHRATGEPMWQLDREAAYERDNVARQLGLRFKQDDFYYQTFYSSTDELAFSNDLAARVKSIYQHNPLLCLRCTASNLIYFWCAGKTPQSTMANLLPQLPYLILGIAGVAIGVRNGQFRRIGVLVLFIVYVVCVHAPILAQARYSMPLLPFISILAAIALNAVRQYKQNPTAQPALETASAGGKSATIAAGFVRHQKESQ